MAYVFNPFTGNLDSYGPILTGTGTVSAAADGTAALPGIAFASDTNTGIYRPGADQLAISTGGTGRLFVDANGNVTQQADSSDLIIKDTQSHTTSDGPLVQFQGRGPNGINYNFGFIRGVSSGINNAGILQFGTNNAGLQDERMRITSTGQIQSNGLGSAVSPALSFTTDTNTGIYSPGADQLAISTGGNGRLFVDANGNVGVGAVQNTSKFNVLTGTSNSTIMELTGASAGRGLKISTYANVANDAGVLIEAPWPNYGQLAFGTAGDERARIDSSGRFLVNTQTIAFTGTNSWFGVYGDASPSTSFAAQSSAGTVAYINRQTDDGELIAFFQDGTQEGSISVSGTTVLFNGAHLSRWSQLPGGAERIEIMRGSVLSNIDEMCEWGEEDNEQLNRMKVSDVEGDKNVSGVFQSWDNDDDTYTNDFYCAMTGDFVIRIAAGITVERGDLLMSAGDGTAKPQDDDIIRSKTIAKVTSTNVSCTYDDGSYCVPCVLMAC